MDEICANMNLLKVEEPEYDDNTMKLKEDLDTFMREIAKARTYDVDVYDLCVSCGHDLTWDVQYTVREIDIHWLQTDGFEYYLKTMHQYSASILEHISDPWTLFRLARHAWSTSNFGVAQDIVCDHLLPKASSEQSFLYFTSVSQILKAENIIAEEGAFGIPRAIPLIQSARRHIW